MQRTPDRRDPRVSSQIESGASRRCRGSVLQGFLIAVVLGGALLAVIFVAPRVASSTSATPALTMPAASIQELEAEHASIEKLPFTGRAGSASPTLVVSPAAGQSHPANPAAGEPATPLAAPLAAPVATAGQEINLRNTVTVEVVRKVADSVVYISTEKVFARTVQRRVMDAFGRVGVIQSPVEETQNSLGSGFIVHESGYIVTNNHVVDRARQIRVTLHDQTEYPAEVISADPETDLAVLKIDTKSPLPALALGDSSDLMIGEPVIAVGNPLGFSSSVSTGIVSAIHRQIKPDPKRSSLSDLIQTDAAINPGNSGGPLLNAYGQVIGINTAIVNEAQNIGFAISISRLRELIPALMDPGKVRKTELTLKLSEKRKLTPPATVSPSIELTTDAGPQTIRTINGKTPRDIIDAYAIVLAGSKMAPITMVTTDGETVTVTPRAVVVPEAIAIAKSRLGVTVEPVTPQVRDRAGLRVDDGMLITEIARKSLAEKAQLQPGDVILGLGRGRVRTIEDFGQLVGELPLKGRVQIAILRGDQLYYGSLEL